jgi:hypothetical protein
MLKIHFQSFSFPRHTILSSLLTFVFPVPSVLPPTIEQILELLSVAQKYEMATTLTRIRDCASRRDPPFICAETALHVYSPARNYDILEETLLAAKETLKAPMTIDTYEDKLDFISIPALCELWDYRVQVLDNLGSDFYTRVSKSEVFQSLTKIGCVELGKSKSHCGSTTTFAPFQRTLLVLTLSHFIPPCPLMSHPQPPALHPVAVYNAYPSPARRFMNFGKLWKLLSMKIYEK